MAIRFWKASGFVSASLLLATPLACSSEASSPVQQIPPEAGLDVQAEEVAVESPVVETGLDTSDVLVESAPEAGADQETDYSGEHTYTGPQGSRKYLVHVPAGHNASPLPLLLLLHGCNQTAEDLRALTEFDNLAEAQKFVTVYAEQSLEANAYGCWNWFLPAHQTRAAGEPAILSAIVEETMAKVSIDPKRVHVAGLSAGGAMAVVLAATWPDRFASTGVVAGCPFKGTPCLNAPSALSVDTLIGFVHEAMGNYLRVMPLILLQGDVDTTVPPANAELLRQQWLGSNDLADDGTANGSIPAAPSHQQTGQQAGGYTWEWAIYDNAQGVSVLESWIVHGLGHAWPGAASGYLYADPKGPNATEEISRFLSEHPLP